MGLITCDVAGYVKTPWENFPSANAVLMAKRLNKIEEGIYQNQEYLGRNRRLVVETGLDPVEYCIFGTPNTSPLTIEAALFNSGGELLRLYAAMGMVVTDGDKNSVKLSIRTPPLYHYEGASITTIGFGDGRRAILIYNKAGFNIKVWVTGSDYVVVPR